MTLPLSKQFSMVFVIFRHYFYFFFYRFLYSYIPTSWSLTRARSFSPSTISSSYSCSRQPTTILRRDDFPLYEKREIKQNEMKINIEVDFNFPPDYGNPSAIHSCSSICMTMCLVWRFSSLLLLLKCVVYVCVTTDARASSFARSHLMCTNPKCCDKW